MKLTLAEIRWMQRGLAAITQMPLPIRPSYRLSKLLNFCNTEMVNVEQSRIKIVKKMAVANPEKPGELKVASENEEAFRKEFEQLLQEEVEVDFVPIKISEFGNDIRISPAELASLSKILEDDS